MREEREEREREREKERERVCVYVFLPVCLVFIDQPVSIEGAASCVCLRVYSDFREGGRRVMWTSECFSLPL